MSRPDCETTRLLAKGAWLTRRYPMSMQFHTKNKWVSMTHNVWVSPWTQQEDRKPFSYRLWNDWKGFCIYA